MIGYYDLLDKINRLKKRVCCCNVGYTLYSSLMYQEGLNDPVATVLSNTTEETFTWEYDGVGVYVAKFPTGTFDQSKTQIWLNPYLGSNSETLHIYGGFETEWEPGVDAFVIRTFADPNTPVDGILGGIGTLPTPFEIRVYP